MPIGPQFGNALTAGARGWDQGQAMGQGFARQRAGNLLSQGDYAGGANALYGAGMLDEGAGVQKIGDDKHAQEAKARIGFLKQAASALSQIPDDGTQTARKAALNQHVLPAIQLMLQGDPSAPQTLQALQSADLSNTSLQTFMGQLDKAELEIVNRGNGAYDVVSKSTGGLVRSVAGSPKGQWVERKRADGGTDRVWLTDLTAEAPQAAPVQGGQGMPPSTDETWRSMIQRESGGRPGVLGPQTRYGRAEGMTQMLPATAQAMAQKLGLPWRPDLMRATTPEAAAYQEKLGRAYYDEGLQKYGGDPNKAAMYYHGGPDEKLWGPKTRAYAQAVAPGGLQGGAGADRIGGETAIPWDAPQPGAGRQPPSGYEWAPDGTQRAIPGGPGDMKANGQTFTQENQLRNGYGQQPSVKDLGSVRSQIGIIGSIAQKARDKPGSVTAADDLALIFAFMKMLDPGSVVREGEFANAQNTAGIPDRVRNSYNRALKGTRLSDHQRAEFFQTATQVMDSYTNSVADQSDRYRGMASSYGLAPDRVAPAVARPKTRNSQSASGPVRVKTPEEARALKPGTVFLTPDGKRKVR